MASASSVNSSYPGPSRTARILDWDCGSDHAVHTRTVPATHNTAHTHCWHRLGLACYCSVDNARLLVVEEAPPRLTRSWWLTPHALELVIVVMLVVLLVVLVMLMLVLLPLVVVVAVLGLVAQLRVWVRGGAQVVSMDSGNSYRWGQEQN